MKPKHAIAGLLLASLLLASPSRADEAAEKQAHLLSRVVVIGASASDGFGAKLEGASAKLAHVVESAIKVEHEKVRHDADAMSFTNPMKFGTEQVNRTAALKPSLVIAVDFLFWHGYGYTPPSDTKRHETLRRLAMLDRGLKLLEKIDAPIIVGDFPDASPAIGFMVAREQVPDKKMLAELNKRLREWAKGRKNVTIFPLDEMVEKIRAGKPFKAAGNEYPANSERTLVQFDSLHPTGEGLVLMTQKLGETLIARSKDHADELDLETAGLIKRARELIRREEEARANGKTGTED